MELTPQCADITGQVISFKLLNLERTLSLLLYKLEAKKPYPTEAETTRLSKYKV